MSRPEFDEKDAQLLKEREAKRATMTGPLVGDYVQMPSEEGYRRFTHDWGDSLQTTCGPKHPCHGDASFYLDRDGECSFYLDRDGECSFYLDRDGECSFSGSLDPSIPKDKIVPVMEETAEWLDAYRTTLTRRQLNLFGNVWFFHHDWPGAYCGVYARIEFKVWEYKP